MIGEFKRALRGKKRYVALCRKHFLEAGGERRGVWGKRC